MAYTTIDKPSDYFNIKLYTGTGSELALTGVGFQPDWVWIKERNGATNQMLTDSVRGATKTLHSQNTDTESTDAQALKSFNSDGFTVGTDGDVNTGSDTYVAWNWKAGSGTSTNTAGNGPDTTINVNQTAGFSIVTWTGNGDAHTFGHGLGANADVVIVKNRESGSSSAWFVNHISVANTKALYLNTTAAETTDAIWGNSAPDSTTFKFDTDNTDNFVAYCFAEKQGYSKFGSYTGNDNADGTFVYLGFSPAFVMIKRTNSVNDWIMLDNKRNPINPSNERILANTSAAASTANTMVDFLSNGFKPRSTYGGINGASDNFIYMAFAENPFVTSTGVPATAR